MPTVEWVAMFKNDYTVKVFTEPGISNDILYWIKAEDDGRISTSVSTNNYYNLRKITIYNEKLESTIIKDEYDWSCTSINETGKDGWGSSLICSITDQSNITKDIKVWGKYFDGNLNASTYIPFELYFTSIMFFISFLSNYEDWADLKIKNAELYNEIVNAKGVPQRIFKDTHERSKELNKFTHFRYKY